MNRMHTQMSSTPTAGVASRIDGAASTEMTLSNFGSCMLGTRQNTKRKK